MERSRKANLFRTVERVDVFIWGKFVGAVALDPRWNYYAFAYDPTFIKSGMEISPLQMPLSESIYIFTDLPEVTYKRLPALLADALPDDFGNALIDRYMANQGISKSQVTALDRLAYMGKRAMGAMEFRPNRGPKTQKPTAIHMNELVTKARSMIQGSIEDDEQTESVLRNIIEVGTSAGGARAKAVIAWNPKTGEITSGQVQTPEDFEYWLLKFDGIKSGQELGSSQDDGRMEYAYYLMAKEAGIQMSECRLLKENGRAHFMTKRFDREADGTKHHLQTLCAMNHLDYKKKSAHGYEQFFMTIRELALGHDSEVEAFRRMVFNIMSRNCDDHTKNVSFRLLHNRKWELSPAYDLTFAHNPLGRWTDQHFMSVNGKNKDITRSDIMAVAERFGIGEAPTIIKEVKNAVQNWPSYGEQSEMNTHRIKEIGAFHTFLD